MASPFFQAWNLLKGMYPMDDPRIQGHLSPANRVGLNSFKGTYEGDEINSEGQATGQYNDVVVDQEVTQMGRPGLSPSSFGNDINHRRRYRLPRGSDAGSMKRIRNEVEGIRYPFRDRDFTDRGD